MKPLGIEDSNLLIIIEHLRSILAKDQILSVSVFGSRARGDYNPYSDVDLLLEGTPPISDSQKESLKEALEEDENLPYKFDLVRIAEIHPPYLKQIQNEKKIWVKLTGLST